MFVLGVGLLSAFIISFTRDVSGGLNLAFSKDLLTPLIAVLVGGIALLAFFRDKDKILLERTEANSKIHYEQAKTLLDRAYEILEVRESDRVSWIYGAALILEAEYKSGLIDKKSGYVQTYKIEKDYIKRKLQGKLRTDIGDALPPAFFFGADDWATSNDTLDELREKTKKDFELFTYDLKRRIPISDPKIKNLYGKSVIAIMSFVTSTEDKQNFFATVNDNEYKNWDQTNGMTQGAKAYLEKINEPPKPKPGDIVCSVDIQTSESKNVKMFDNIKPPPCL